MVVMADMAVTVAMAAETCSIISHLYWAQSARFDLLAAVAGRDGLQGWPYRPALDTIHGGAYCGQCSSKLVDDLKRRSSFLQRLTHRCEQHCRS